MEDRKKKQMFLQMQFSLLLLSCALIPDMTSLVSSFFEVPSLDIPVLLCHIIGIVGSGMALYIFYTADKSLSRPYLAVVGIGLVLAVLSLFMDMPIWSDIISIVLLMIAFFMGKGCLQMNWNNIGTQGAYIILLSILLRLYDGIGDSFVHGILAFVGVIMFWIGLGKLRLVMDAEGTVAISRLKTALILNLIAIIFGWIPLLGSIVAGILLIIAFILEFIGYGAMKRSAAVGEEGRIGAGRLRTSMIILLVGTIISIIPLLGTTVSAFISLVGLVLVYQGWRGIFFGVDKD
ncbi:hypothetical protein QUW02_04320 [Bacteroides eggerthii]|uniref:Transmembrane protein n=1 Tax=Bacteroides eggerthii TaxID=28111 RepID=A0ABT7U5V9_9BACE|nr:hypothetical protein [Bacteroides eggerthii]